jgi:hypothetical protein
VAKASRIRAETVRGAGAAGPQPYLRLVRSRAPIAVVAAGVVLILALLTSRHGAPATTPAVVASWTLTPGVLNPDVTQATVERTICTHGWTKTIRPPVDYTNRLKLEQMREYDLAGDPSGYQEDHLVSLELGGHPTDPRNLWPEPRPRAEEVDAVENELNARVCDGSLSLAQAQRKISELKHTKG